MDGAVVVFVGSAGSLKGLARHLESEASSSSANVPDGVDTETAASGVVLQDMAVVKLSIGPVQAASSD